MDTITTYIAGLMARFSASMGKRLADAGLLHDFDVVATPRRGLGGNVTGYFGGVRLAYIDASGRLIGVTSGDLAAEDADAFIQRAEAAVSILFPEIPRPEPVHVVSVDENLTLGEPEPAPEPAPTPAKRR